MANPMTTSSMTPTVEKNPSSSHTGNGMASLRSPSSESHFEKVAHSAGESIGSLASRVTDTAADYVRTGREYVKENPVKGVAAAAAVGLVAGSLLTLALRRRS